MEYLDFEIHLREILQWGLKRGWSQLTNCHNMGKRHDEVQCSAMTAEGSQLNMCQKVAKTREMQCSASVNGFSPELDMILEYMGVYRKMIVEFMFQQTIEKLYGEIVARYYNIHTLEDFKSNILREAFGSQKITSDYDITLTGPAVHKIMWHVIDNIYKKYGNTATFLFDVNIYIAPDFVNCESVTKRLTECGLRFISHKRRLTPILPVHFIRDERKSILSKIGKNDATLSPEDILERYRRLRKYGGKIDELVYGPLAQGSGLRAKSVQRQIIKTLLHMNKVGIESYHGLSTILVVVNGIQQKKNDVFNELTSSHIINAALENLIDLYNHWNAVDSDSNLVRAATLEKLKKYRVRITTCLDKVKERIDPLKGEDIEQIKSLISSPETVPTHAALLRFFTLIMKFDDV